MVRTVLTSTLELSPLLAINLATVSITLSNSDRIGDVCYAFLRTCLIVQVSFV